MGLDPREPITFPQISIPLYCIVLVVLLFAFSESYLNPQRENSIRRVIIALKSLGLLIIGPGLIFTFYFKLETFPTTLICIVSLFYFKLSLWGIISASRTK